MKVIATLSLLLCLTHGALGGDLTTATPSPTPYLGALPRRGTARGIERRAQRRAREAEAEKVAASRAEAKANRRTAAAAQTQAREAARNRERAQRQVDAEARREKSRETQRPTSDLMKRMGFSEEEIAAQRALEESAKAEAHPNASPTQPAEPRPANASPTPGK